VPTGIGHTIGQYGAVEGAQEPMHTNFGVHRLGGYPTIRYFVPALISTGVGGWGCCFFCDLDVAGHGGRAREDDRRFSRTK
jgi:hypothetical protein